MEKLYLVSTSSIVGDLSFLGVIKEGDNFKERLTSLLNDDASISKVTVLLLSVNDNGEYKDCVIHFTNNCNNKEYTDNIVIQSIKIY